VSRIVEFAFSIFVAALVAGTSVVVKFDEITSLTSATDHHAVCSVGAATP
jgi:hypothetical protein